eukprot:3344663-Pleurochrysis_carterae.AAC.1
MMTKPICRLERCPTVAALTPAFSFARSFKYGRKRCQTMVNTCHSHSHLTDQPAIAAACEVPKYPVQ